ncbi:MAG: hypothetical protein HFF17_04495 [Oscillospiraceae bacterium]|nr:hypothetical protein [Oscillospiraceae bacterium]
MNLDRLAAAFAGVGVCTHFSLPSFFKKSFKIALVAHAKHQARAADILSHRAQLILRIVGEQDAVPQFFDPLLAVHEKDADLDWLDLLLCTDKRRTKEGQKKIAVVIGWLLHRRSTVHQNRRSWDGDILEPNK